MRGGGAGSEAFGEPEEREPQAWGQDHGGVTQFTCVFLQENKKKKTRRTGHLKRTQRTYFPPNSRKLAHISLRD